MKSGSKIICLMATGSSSFDKGLTQITMRTSTDGTTWSEPQSLSFEGFTSYYVTPGKGVVYTVNNVSRVAFVINAKVGGRTREYLLYSDDEGSHWSIDTETALAGKGKESKLEVKNNGTSLIVMGKAPVSKECNNDLLYFKRSGDDQSSFDAILQTIMWKNDGDPKRLKDMRLYASFDQATTWKELFYIQPGNAGASSMQKLSDGNLAICFEDGSIGNDEMDGCYTLTYAVIDQGMVAEQSASVNQSTIVKTGDNRDSGAPFVNGSGWTKSVVTNSASGFAGITISANHAAFNREGNAQRYFIIKPSAAGASDVITITAPSGYVIKSYSITGNRKTTENYTLTSGNESATFNGGDTNARTLTVDNIFSPTATFTFMSNSGTNNSYSLISDFKIILTREEYGVKLNRVNEGTSKSYATLYTEYDLQQIDGYTKAYYIKTVEDGRAMLTETPNEGRDIPKNTAVVLINSEGSTYAEFVLINNLPPVVAEDVNLLKGTLTGITLPMSTNENIYSFGRRRVRADENSAWGEYVAGFYNTGNDLELGANRCYLNTGTTQLGQSRGFDLPFEGDMSGITDVQLEYPASTIETPWYTLDGRQLNGTPNKRGIYVKNGKKIVMK